MREGAWAAHVPGLRSTFGSSFETSLEDSASRTHIERHRAQRHQHRHEDEEEKEGKEEKEAVARLKLVEG
jgi:DNA-directed RNA polymerase specialized sigma24 family protein